MSKLRLENVCYKYEKSTKFVLKDVSYEFEKGNIYAIIGKSGAGKTTLLSLLSGLTKPTSGTIYLDGEDTQKKDMYAYRSQDVGVIFQSFNLLPKLTAVENVILSMDVSGRKFGNKKEIAMDLLHKVGLDEDEAQRRILKLSGGQQQRVAIARALSYGPEIILADEPTGNLDGETQDDIMEIFRKLAKDENKCVIIVTHSPEVTKKADVVYELKKSDSGKSGTRMKK